MTAGRLLQMSGIVVDLIYRVERLPSPGDQVLVDDHLIAAGGGFNAMISAKRGGMDVAYGGTHGTGLFADLIRRDLADIGIPLLQPRSPHTDQGSCIVLVDSASERTFISKEGAEGLLDAEMLTPLRSAEFDWALLSGYGLTYAGSRNALGTWLDDLPDTVSFVFDPAPVVGQISTPLLERALARAQWVSANASEAEALTGQSTPAASAQALCARMSRHGRGAVVRCGELGCTIAERGQAPAAVPQFAVDTIDTNGAGDAHVGSFIAALSGGAAPKEAAEYANAAAALTTTAPTPTSSHDDEAVKALIRSRRDVEPIQAAKRR